MDSRPGAVDTSNIVAVCQNNGALDQALLREMLGYFIDENRRRVQELRDAAAADARHTVRHVAHAVRGSAALLGAGRLHDLSWSLEMDAEITTQADLQGQVLRIADEFEAVLTTLQRTHPDATTGF